MKTPMQELIEQLKEERDGFLKLPPYKLPPYSNIQERTENCFGSCIEIAERMLEKEKEQIMDAYSQGREDAGDFVLVNELKYTSKDYYNETFNTNEK